MQEQQVKHPWIWAKIKRNKSEILSLVSLFPGCSYNHLRPNDYSASEEESIGHFT